MSEIRFEHNGQRFLAKPDTAYLGSLGILALCQQRPFFDLLRFVVPASLQLVPVGVRISRLALVFVHGLHFHHIRKNIYVIYSDFQAVYLLDSTLG